MSKVKNRCKAMHLQLWAVDIEDTGHRVYFNTINIPIVIVIFYS